MLFVWIDACGVLVGGVDVVVVVVVVSAMPVAAFIPGVNVTMRTFRTWPGSDAVRAAMICWI